MDITEKHEENKTVDQQQTNPVQTLLQNQVNYERHHTRGKLNIEEKKASNEFTGLRVSNQTRSKHCNDEDAFSSDKNR